MSDNVVKLVRPIRIRTHDVTITLTLTEDGELDSVIVPSNHHELVSTLMRAAWLVNKENRRETEDKGDDDVLFMTKHHRNGNVTIFSDNVDFDTTEEMIWLKKSLDAALRLAPPSSLEEPTASGTTSASLSENFDQMQFSW